MRLLVDSCVAGLVARVLQTDGHDVVWAGDWDSDPGDSEIPENAYQERRVLVTLDKDFGELIFAQGRPHAGLVRIVNLPVAEQAAICLQVLRRHGQALEMGAIATAEPGRLRLRSQVNLRQVLTVCNFYPGFAWRFSA